MTSYIKDFTINFGGPTNGTSDAVGAWQDYKTFIAGLNPGDDVTLNLAGVTYNFIASVAGKGIALGKGILGGVTQTIVGTTGTKFTHGGGAGFFLGTATVYTDNLHSARIATVAAGATQVTLLTPSQNSRFSVNQWVLVGGITLQSNGYPQNFAFFEFVQVTAINTGTGVVTFTPALQYAYKSTWPLYQAGDGSNPDQGGPATIYAMPSDWDMDITYNNITFEQPGGSYISARAATITSCVVSAAYDTLGMIPTNCKTVSFANCTQTGAVIEVDKLLQSLSYSGGSLKTLIHQSPNQDCVIDGVTFDAGGGVTGTARKMTITNCPTVRAVTLGPTVYGGTKRFTADSCSGIDSIGSSNTGVVDFAGQGFTMAGGTIRWAKSNGPTLFAIPGAWCFWKGSAANEDSVFQVLDVADDGTNTIITTTASGGVPNVPLNAGKIDLMCHPCESWNGTNLTGCADAIDLSQPGAQAKPVWSYSKRSYTGNTLPSASSFPLWGQLRSLQVIVSQAYTGVQATLVASVGGNSISHALSPDRTTDIGYEPTVNLKTIHTVTFGPTSVTGNISGDSSSPPGNIWFAGIQGMAANHDVSGEVPTLWPIFSVEYIAYQGLDEIPPDQTTKHIRKHRMISHFPSTDWVFVQ